MFNLKKNVTLPHLAILHKKFRSKLGRLELSLDILLIEVSVNFSLILKSQEM
jgi:hypothetical protein